METHNSSDSGKGCLTVIGIGPGSLAYLTPAARTALEQSDVIVGYRTYLALIEPLIQEKEILLSSMMQEVDRVKSAFELAEQGRRVALVSGGDPGIYAMAGLVYEMAYETDSAVDIRVIAGIAAVNSCAERLGAPLMHDFATISLSDLLTPWETIEKRIEAAAAADFVIVIYNPQSKKRTWQLTRTCELVMRHRSPQTPVGIVKAATRENEEIALTTLASIDTGLVDMQTTVIIGNSTTFIWRDKMITPRGYKAKYRLD